ncbi:MAG: hypothetical protein MZV64_73690 [Ignavibacteriales bacterium]|nr:hypothetical protein [Ignavibacteriales bacterium]
MKGNSSPKWKSTSSRPILAGLRTSPSKMRTNSTTYAKPTPWRHPVRIPQGSSLRPHLVAL